jgi:solute carrier family 25 S-adenosylmethionine transporter 26
VLRFANIDWHKSGEPDVAALAGALTSVMTKSLLYPFDTWKLHQQTNKPLPRQLVHVYRGLFPKLLLYSPYQALYMGSYTWFRDKLRDLPGFLAYPVAGVFADLASCPVRLPMEVLKQRMQAGRISSLHEVATSWSTMRSLVSFRLFRAQTLLHDIPYGIVQWSVYEAVNRSLRKSEGERNSLYLPVIAGTVSGGLAALVTTPLDVLKTRSILSDQHVAIRSICADLVQNEGGLKTLLTRGAVFRVLHIAPASGLYFGIFNFIYSSLAS